MKFEPKSFAFGKSASFGMNIVLIGALLFAGFDFWKKKKSGNDPHETTMADSTAGPKQNSAGKA